MQTSILATSSSNLPILAHRFQGGGPEVLVLGGVHGDEPEGVWAALHLIQRMLHSPDLRLNLTVVPTFNLDGILDKRRTNGRGVDLNRNLPTKDWQSLTLNPRYPPGPFANSESENQGLTTWLEIHRPKLVVSLHSWKPLLNVNGDCRKPAEAIARHLGYPIEESIGYPTPGCLGTYCGLERNMPTLTFEIERGLDQNSIRTKILPALWEGLKTQESP